MNAKSFLHKIGIKPIRKSQTSEETPYSHPMSSALMDEMFATEASAVRTLGTNFDRVANSMERVSNAHVFRNGKLPMVGELGAGTGLIGMWLVARGLCESCVIFDHAKRPLAIGEKWATELGLSGVRFVHAPYSELRGAKPEFDFIVAEHAVPMDFMVLGDGTFEQMMDPRKCPYNTDYRDLSNALNSMLKPRGYGLIGSGLITPLCAIALCVALRDASLCIDWEPSSNRDGLQLFVMRGETLLNSAEEEALALLSDVKDRREFHKRDVLSLESIFRQGRKYVEVVSEQLRDSYRCSIYQFAGLAGLFQASSNGVKTARIFSAGSIPRLARDVLDDGRKRTVISMFIEPTLNTILEKR